MRADPVMEKNAGLTPFRSKSVYEEILSSFSDYKNKWSRARIAFIEYLLAEDASWCLVPDHPNFSGKRQSLGVFEVWCNA